MQALALNGPVTEKDFDEVGYLAANPDVKAAVARGEWASGRAHFDVFGKTEGRQQRRSGEIEPLRRRKLQRIQSILRTDMERVGSGGKPNFLTSQLREEAHLADTENVSSNAYDSRIIDLIHKHDSGMLLDCGAGRRDIYYDNVVNYEIVDYDTTDVIGVGEHLPFVDDCFDAVISVAVLEHVRDPFSCANELIRVLKPGGDLFCCIPFLQPLHGYPHHYFNASPQGHRSLFEDRLEVNDVFVVPATHPVASLSWILSSWSAGLSDEIRDEFLDMKVSELIRPTAELLPLPFAAALPKDKQLELASATVLTARKPRRPSSGGGKSLSGRSAR
jgi:hypothetical protein